LDVIVDGVSKGAVSTFTFTDVTANHTIEATFAIRTYTITASAELNGSISPSGAVVVNCGSNRTFDIEAADPCHYILDVKVDGASQGAVSTFTFTDVTANHTIEATFAIYTYTITVSAEPTGSISPGSVVVNCGSNQTFTIESEPGFMIFRILVDGSQITISNPFTMTYTFSNVTSNHIIQAEFMKIPDITPPTITYISGIDINVPSDIKTNKDTYTFTVGAFDESGIARMIIKVNGIVQIDKNNLDPTLYLSEGVNTVEVTVYDTCGNYTTKSFKVIKDSRPPVVNLTIPEKAISSTIEVKGIIYDELSGVKSVLINDTPYNLPLSGNVSLTLNLRGGVNIITVEATDNLENTTKKTYNVTYTPVSATSIIIALQIDNPEITINGISKKIDAQGSKPIIKNGRTLLPIRVLIESLGGTVEWNAKEQKVTITLNGHSIILWIGKTTALVDGNKVTLDVASQIINGRTYIPIRFIAENLNALVQWDQSTKTVTIYYWP
jgi:FtsP/CotA-like multicopper oxidase with cupredoxin domain